MGTKEPSVTAALAAFEHGPMGMMAFEGDDLTVVSLNGTARALLGASRDVVGLPYAAAFPKGVDQGYLELMRDVASTGEPAEAREWRVLVAPPGEQPRELFVDFTIRPWCHDDGTPRGVLVYVTDVTEQVLRRREVEQQVQTTRTRYDEARELVYRLQENLLPDSLPVVPGLQTMGRYALAQVDTSAGGDWLDVVPRPGGRACLVVGDVVGHGVAASATMGQLRAVLSERLHAGASIGDALGALDAFARGVPGAAAATVVVVEVDPEEGSLSYCTAGHPPPLLLQADGPRFLAPTGSGPLATGSEMVVGHDRLEVGDLVLLCSDGILERPGLTAAQATVELATVSERVVRHGVFDPERPVVDRVCAEVFELVTRRTGFADDITLLSAQRVEPVPPLVTDLPVSPEALGHVRAAVSGWLDRHAADARDIVRLQHAVGEAVANVLEHAYVDRPDAALGRLELLGELRASGQLRIVVTDQGGWRASSGAARGGRGLAMMGGLVDDVALDRRDGGTSLELRDRLSRPVRHDASADQASAPVFRHLEIETVPGGLRLVGTVDLEAVDLLASAGVQVLFAARRLADDRGSRLRLLASPGTPAQQVLDLVGLPHDAR